MSPNTYAITNLLFGVLLMPACNAARQAPKVSPPTFYVLSGKAAERLVGHCSEDFIRGVEGYWMPAEPDLQKLTFVLNQHLNSFPPDLQARLLSYTRQYAGTIKGGRKQIFVNGFAREFGEGLDLSSEAFVGCDGGTMIYGVEYDVERQSLHNFRFNTAR
jgi:hypothetical protein